MNRLCESKKRHIGRISMIFIGFILLVYLVRLVIPPPKAVENRSAWFPLIGANLLLDSSWQTPTQLRMLDQSIFNAIVERIDAASGIILLDMFLFNDWQGPEPEKHRALAAELTDALLRARQRNPNMPVIVVTDPINTLYGGVESSHLQALAAAHISVVQTPLEELQDSNPVYSAIWRGLVRPWGNSVRSKTLKAPFGDERISIRSWLSLLNFKANHRKLLITQTDTASGPNNNGWQAIVSSANPHDGSSAHRNLAIDFSGDAVIALLQSEIKLLELAASAGKESVRRIAVDASNALQVNFSNALNTPLVGATEEQMNAVSAINSPFVRVLTEKAILHSVLGVIDSTNQGDEVNVLMFYLSHRSIVRALAQAATRGVNVRVLLDANKDAFGRTKNGVPNRPVAHELSNAGVNVRWCATSGEQCHAKVIHVKTGDQQRLISGSGNYTRRNLDNLNLETNVDIRVRGTSPLIEKFSGYFNAQWHNSNNRQYSLDYGIFADHSLLKKWQYRFMEASGVGTF